MQRIDNKYAPNIRGFERLYFSISSSQSTVTGTEYETHAETYTTTEILKEGWDLTQLHVLGDIDNTTKSVEYIEMGDEMFDVVFARFQANYETIFLNVDWVGLKDYVYNYCVTEGNVSLTLEPIYKLKSGTKYDKTSDEIFADFGLGWNLINEELIDTFSQ